jgi:MFS transporter, ACS family, glucarate transporter
VIESDATVTASNRIVFMMIAASAIVYMERMAVSIAAPDIIRDLGISETQMGSVFSAFYLAYTGFMFGAGALCDRSGARRTLAVAGSGAALCTALTAACGLRALIPLAAAFGLLLVSRFCSGACMAPVYPACAKLIGNWFPPASTARMQSFVFSATFVGMALLPLTVTPMIGRFGWKAVFLIFALSIAGVFWLWRIWVQDNPPEVTAAAAFQRRDPSRIRGGISILQNRNVLLLSGSYAAFCYFSVLLESWVFYYYREVRGFGATQSATYMTAMLITAALASVSGGWLSDRLVLRFGTASGRRALPISGLALSVVFCFLGASGFAPLVTAASLALSYGFLSFSEPAFWAFTIELTGEHSGKACGLMNTGGNCGSILGPLTAPMIAARFGWTAALCAGGAIALCAVLPWLSITAGAARDVEEHLSSAPAAVG